MSGYQYVPLTAPHHFPSDSRHEAVGRLAKYGDPDRGRVVAVVDSCLVRWPVYPEHLGDKYYGDRDYLATKHGAVRVHREETMRIRNGNPQEVLDSHWEIRCPVCHRKHTSQEGTEVARGDLIDTVLACCGTDWYPPSDWVADCGICGDDHRDGDCTPVSFRDPFPGIDRDYACHGCGWSGPGEAVAGPSGECPKCRSSALEATE